MREIILNVIQNIIEDKNDNHIIPAVATWTDIKTILNREYPDSLFNKKSYLQKTRNLSTKHCY